MGGGLAGLAAAAKLGAAGFSVEIHEARPFLGGRAASFPMQPADPRSEHIDNCQHVLLRCCTALLDFYRRCGVERNINFHKALYLVRSDGRVDTIRADPLPVPWHLARSLLSMGALDWRDKTSLARCMLAVRKDRHRADIDSIPFSAWLEEKGATPRSIARFWRPFVVSALNEEPQRASAGPALQVFAEGLLGSRSSYELGVPCVPLGELYSRALEEGLGASVKVILGSKVSRIDPTSSEADYYVSAVPFERVTKLVPALGLDDALARFEHSPITGIHLWFDRPITDLPHALLLDQEIQWVFRKGAGYYLAVISASRGMVKLSPAEIVHKAVSDLRECFPRARQAALEKSHVIKELRATYSVRPGLDLQRPGPITRYSNVFLAGDWIATGWPATMEGAVRSGYQAAEAVMAAAQQAHGASAGCVPRN